MYNIIQRKIKMCSVLCRPARTPKLNSCHSCLQHERGVHRIQRVPVTESHGRLHTSTSVVVVLPQPEDVSAQRRALPTDVL